ncbi:hypothetical protein V1286_000001, partial [Bradyrhizobium algeriense]
SLSKAWALDAASDAAGRAAVRCRPDGWLWRIHDR